MPSTFDFCLPSSGKAVPSGPDWLHEIKYDGFRVRIDFDELVSVSAVRFA
jgi:ATP-dependent DNA ligase